MTLELGTLGVEVEDGEEKGGITSSSGWIRRSAQIDPNPPPSSH